MGVVRPILLGVSILLFALLASAGQTPGHGPPNAMPPMTNWTRRPGAGT
jgi:hypothetical protein